MPEVLTCPKCDRKLQVPETLMGQDVQCPTCQATFLAQPAGSPAPSQAKAPAPATATRELDRPSRREEEEDDDDDDYDEVSSSRRRMRRKRRRNYEPHRGSLIMALGIISLFVAQIVLGPIAWIMANRDLEAMRKGRMDPEGEGATNTGRICGMIATILGILGLLAAIAFFCLWIFAFAAILGSAKSKR